MAKTSLTDEQKAFLAECEEEFKDRFTEKDTEFAKIHAVKTLQPPIMDPWHNRNYNWSSRNWGPDQRGRRNQSWKHRDHSDRNSDFHPYRRSKN